MLIGDKLSDEYGAEGRAASDAGDAAFVDAFVSKINKNKTSDWIESIQGVSISTTECNTCREKVINPEVFIALTLDIFDNIPDMSEMILNFFKTEEMQEWKCDKCKTLGGSKRLHLHKLPPVLVILLKRFKMSAAGIEKLHNPVNILQGVDITYQNKKCSYKLKSIGNHFGAYGGGHYTACCNSGAVWNHIDDLSINNLKIEDIVTNNTAAYILFYEQAAAE